MYPQTTLSSWISPPGVAQSEVSFSRLSELSAVGAASEASRLPSYFPAAVASLQVQNSDVADDYGCVASSSSRDTVSTAGRPSVQLTFGPRSQLVRGIAHGFSGAPTESSADPRDIRHEAVDRLYQFLRTESQLQQNWRHQHQHCSYSTVTPGVDDEPTLYHPPSSSSGMLVTPPCGHLGYRKRLRVKKGYSYFVCRYCGFKWRFPTQRRQEELLLQSQLVCC